MADHFTAARAGTLFPLLAEHFASWARNTLRERLRLGCVEVDGAVVTRHDHAVSPGARIAIRAKAQASTPVARGVSGAAAALPVLHLDAELLAIDKPHGLLSVSTDDEHERTALARARSLLPGGRGDLWPVHRLDRETSGVLLLARTRAARDAVQRQWASAQKVYLAVVEGCPEAAAGTVDQPLWEDSNLRVRVGDHRDAKPARTRYRVVQRGAGRCLLEVELETGRKHQIRAHLAWLGIPVVGDDRYGATGPRLCLHALRLTVPHPRTGQPLVVASPIPRDLLAALDRSKD